MIDSADWFLVGMLNAFTAVVVSALWLGYNVTRLYEVKRDCAKQIGLANRELIEMRNMHIAYKDIPVEKLIGLETFDAVGEEEQ